MPAVNIFILAKVFLPKILSCASTMNFLFYFSVAGISYALAGSQAYAEVFHINR